MHAQEIEDDGPIAAAVWARRRGISNITFWRWRQGKIIQESDLVNIAGRIYITAAGRQRFYEQAEAGAFAKKPSAGAYSKKPKEREVAA